MLIVYNRPRYGSLRLLEFHAALVANQVPFEIDGRAGKLGIKPTQTAEIPVFNTVGAVSEGSVRGWATFWRFYGYEGSNPEMAEREGRTLASAQFVVGVTGEADDLSHPAGSDELVLLDVYAHTSFAAGYVSGSQEAYVQARLLAFIGAQFNGANEYDFFDTPGFEEAGGDVLENVFHDGGGGYQHVARTAWTLSDDTEGHTLHTLTAPGGKDFQFKAGGQGKWISTNARARLFEVTDVERKRKTMAQYRQKWVNGYARVHASGDVPVWYYDLWQKELQTIDARVAALGV